MEIIECKNGKRKYYRLKIEKRDYLNMQTAILKILYNNPEIRKGYIENGLSDERFRWDMLWKSDFDVMPLYNYLHDSHIDTALKHIIDY